MRSGAIRAQSFPLLTWYVMLMLRSFADKETERVGQRRRSRVLDPNVQRAALRKLDILEAAETV